MRVNRSMGSLWPPCGKYRLWSGCGTVPQKKTTRVCWYWGVARRVDARAGLVAGHKKGTDTIFTILTRYFGTGLLARVCPTTCCPVEAGWEPAGP